MPQNMTSRLKQLYSIVPILCVNACALPICSTIHSLSSNHIFPMAVGWWCAREEKETQQTKKTASRSLLPARSLSTCLFFVLVCLTVNITSDRWRESKDCPPGVYKSEKKILVDLAVWGERI